MSVAVARGEAVTGFTIYDLRFASRALISRPFAFGRVNRQSCIAKSFVSPSPLNVRDATLDFLHRETGAEFEDLDVFAFHGWFEGGKIHRAGAGRAMIACG